MHCQHMKMPSGKLSGTVRMNPECPSPRPARSPWWPIRTRRDVPLIYPFAASTHRRLPLAGHPRHLSHRYLQRNPNTGSGYVDVLSFDSGSSFGSATVPSV